MLTRIVTAAAVLPLSICSLPASAHADPVRAAETKSMRSLHLAQAWRTTRGQGAVVAVLDSGVDAAQPDLKGSVTTGPDFTKGANPPGTAPKRLHGTGMASIIAGHGHGHGAGVLGVAPQARLLSARVLLEDDEPGFRIFNANEHYRESVAKGVRWAVAHGADVINLSLGQTDPLKEERQAIEYAADHGVVVVAAAGNQGKNGRFSYPASYPGVISVAAVTAKHKRATFSNRNSAVMVAAPGVHMVTAGPDRSYWVGDGTSPATAVVSGIAALIRARYPKMAPQLVAQSIAAGATPPKTGSYDDSVGFGEVNAASALAQAAKFSTYHTDGAGLKANWHFGVHQPVRVVQRDFDRLEMYAGLTVAGITAFLAAFGFLTAGRRRRPRKT